MTMPAFMNCAHSGDGWCLKCVAELEAENAALRLFDELPFPRAVGLDATGHICDWKCNAMIHRAKTRPVAICLAWWKWQTGEDLKDGKRNDMTNETRVALKHFLAHAGRPVAEALRAEVGLAVILLRTTPENLHLFDPSFWWRNEGWRAAWEKAMPRFGMGLGPTSGGAWAAFTNENGPYFCCPPDFLAGDELADALRDWALGETR